MKFIFLGPPGAGKGTLSALASREFGIPHISTGDLFRKAIKDATELGKKVKAIIERGDLVPDEITVAIVEERLALEDAKNGFILDGFPRTIPQAVDLANISRIDKVINFVLPDEEIIKRLSGRRVCPKCGETFHVQFLPPKKENTCDTCGSALSTRKDDEVDSIKNRLDVYKKQTEPLINYYKGQGILLDIDASPPPGAIFATLKHLV